MNAAVVRRGTQTGISRFELLGSVIIIVVLGSVLLHRLARYQEIARNAVVEMTVNNMRSGLHLRVAELMMADRATNIAQLVEQNPVQWLDSLPTNYGGDLATAEAIGIGPDRWYYDIDRKVLVYVFPYDGQFPGTNSKRRTLKVYVTVTQAAAFEGGGSMSVAQGVALTTRVSED